MPVPVQGQQQHAAFQNGDIIAGGRTPGQFFSFGRFEWFLPDGTLNLRMAEAFDVLPTDVAIDSAGNACYPTFRSIIVFDRSGQSVGTFPRFSTRASAITFDRDGNAYIGADQSVRKTTPAGDLLATFQLPVEGQSGIVSRIDLASDQCTLFYTSLGKRVLRYDVCRDVALPDLTNALPGLLAHRIRILPDGGVLVTAADVVVRLDKNGSHTRTYDLVGTDSWNGLAIGVDGQSFWATSSNMAFRFDLESGAVLDSFQASDYFFDALAIVGEPRAAVAPLAIPAIADWMLGLLATLLGAVGVCKLT